MLRSESKSSAWLESSQNTKEGCISCARYTLVVFNVLFFCGGTLLVCLAAWLRWHPSNLNLFAIATSSSSREYVVLLTVLSMVSGSAAIVLSVVGCGGSAANSKYILGTFYMFLVVLFLLLFALGGLSFWLQARIDNDVVWQLEHTFVINYNGDEGINIESVAWKHLQTDLKCCGVSEIDGFNDYATLDVGIKKEGIPLIGAAFWRSKTNETSSQVWPISCCIKDLNGDYLDLKVCQQANASTAEARYQRGCGSAVKELLKVNMLIITGLTAGLIVIEIIHFYVLWQLEAVMLGQDEDSMMTQLSFEQLNENVPQHYKTNLLVK